MPASVSQFTARFLFKVALTVLLVWLGDWMFFQRELYGGHFGLYALALLAALMAGRPAIWCDRRALAAVAFALVFAFALIRDAGLLTWTLFWTAAAMATLLPMTGRFDDGWRWFQRLVWLSLQAPFAPLFDWGRMLKARRRRTSRRYLQASLPQLVLPVLGSAVFLFLFAAANPVLEHLFASLRFPELSIPGFFRTVLWVLLALTAWTLLRPRLAQRPLPTFDGSGDLALPGVSPGSVTLSLIAFNLIFALQNLMDLLYLGGLASMPAGVTLADYAHRGAYPLIATALLAALFVLATLRPGSATAEVPLIRRLVVVWIAQNIVLVGSSILRTVDYVDAYSLTGLRIAALAWMGLVGFGLAAICWRLLHRRSAAWLININLAAALTVLTVASFVDIGTVAAQWNVRHAREVGGTGVHLDLCYLNRLGASALLPLIELEGRSDIDPAFRERVQAVREMNLDQLERDQTGGGWSLRGQWRLEQAYRILAKRPIRTIAQGERLCNGALYETQVPKIEAPASKTVGYQSATSTALQPQATPR